jgi:hypothetical protein
VFFLSDVGCYHFIGTYARLSFRVRAHNFSLRGSLGGDRLPTQAYAREVLCNFSLNMPTRPQSQQHFRMIAWINDRIKDNEGEEGHVIIHWL